MYSYRKLLLFIFASAVIFIIQACSSTLINLSIAKDEIINYHESGKYDEEASEIADKAINEFKNIDAKNNSTIIFDIDETALSNYEYHKKYDFGYIPDLWDEWINEAKAPAIKGVKHLYDFLISKGFRIVFLTGRKDYQYEPTYKNLINAGYKKFDTLIVRTPPEYETSAADYKSKKRTELVQHGYDIVGDVGDQYSDFTGPFHGIQVKIPNYQYIVK